MRVLFLTQVLPYPPELGASVKTWNVLRYLSFHGYDITLASFVRPDETEYVPHLNEVCKAVYTVPLVRSRVFDARTWFRSHITGRPFLIERDDLPGMRSLIRQLLEEHHYDLIHTDQLTMAQYALPSPIPSPFVWHRYGRRPWNPRYIRSNNTPRLIFDAHNAVWIIMERLHQTLPKAFHPLLKLEARRIKSYEGMLLNEFDHTLAQSEFDRDALYEAWMTTRPGKRKNRKYDFYHRLMEPAPITVVPIAVDAGPLAQIIRRPGSRSILVVGSLEDRSDADGVRWFLKKVFPLIVSKTPDIKLTVVTHKAPADLVRFVADSFSGRVNFTSSESTLKPIYGDCAAIAAPVRLAGETRGYILEAFARGMPLITTSLGLDGTAARPGDDVLVADSPEEFALQVHKLMEDRSLQEKLSLRSLRLAEEHYNWMTALKPLERVYKTNGVGVPA